MLKRITTIIKETEFGQEEEASALIDPSRIESVTELDRGDVQTEIVMHSGDFHMTPLSLREVEELLD